MPRIVVVGSINMDLVTVAERFVEPGETLRGTRFFTVPGGKGANQAVAAARLEAEVSLVAALGDDVFGDELHRGLGGEGIDMSYVRRIRDCASGTASIGVAQGENRIVIVPAANDRLTPGQVEAARPAFERADAILVQLEIPLPAVEASLRLGRQLGVPVILDPAPAPKMLPTWLGLAAYLTPNKHELAQLMGVEADANADFRPLLEGSELPIVLTCGARGVWYRDGGELKHQPAFAATAVDSTGAGDTFNAAFAVFLVEGLSQAVRKAAAAAALSVTTLGAQAGMPRREALGAYLAASEHP